MRAFPGNRRILRSRIRRAVRVSLFVPNYDGHVAQYDTTAPFTSASSWQTFDTGMVGAKGYAGAVFDGQYVYFVPHQNVTYDGTVARYNTQASFTSVGSWSTFDMTTVSGAANDKGFIGGAFDGRYVYFVPDYNGTTVTSIVMQYDTKAGNFNATTSWTPFDVSAVNAASKGFIGAVFDGRYVYFVPYAGSASTVDGVATRYDTTGTFTSNSSWSTFDTTGVNSGAKGFQGGTFDGRYVYFVPSYNGASDGIATRYDTEDAGFTTASSWTTFDMTTVNAGLKGFVGGAFDGRYVYFSPCCDPSADGLTARYDTTAPFNAAGSYETFNMTSVNSGAIGFFGAAFDGRYVYFVPNNNGSRDGIVIQFDAKTPSSMPSSYHGSFF